jgi:CRISPR-associated protein Csm4
MIVKLKPLSLFKGSALPRSDTIFGGICWGLAILYSENLLVEVLQSFRDKNPPFIISSSFPWKKDTYFLPKPLTANIDPGNSPEEIKKAKGIKKIQYISSEVFNRLINGEPKIYLNMKEQDTMEKIKFEDIPHNTINRLSDNSEHIFYSQEGFIKDGGIYFFIKIFDRSLEKKLTGAINWLSERGIGGDSSTGKGHFTAEFTDEELIKEPAHPDRSINLSLLYLSKEDKTLMKSEKEKCSYELVKRKGRVESAYSPSTDIWKRTVLMLKEGSLLPVKEGFYGENVIVKDLSWKIWQYGYGYMVKGVMS